jgi:hypothetical protein
MHSIPLMIRPAQQDTSDLLGPPVPAPAQPQEGQLAARENVLAGLAQPPAAAGHLTHAERLHLAEVEAQIEAGLREEEGGRRKAAVGIREVHEQRLYRDEYNSFEEYVETRWNRTRRWAYMMLHWVDRCERLEQAGVKSISHLGLAASEALAPLESYPEEFVQAVLRANELIKAQPKEKYERIIRGVVQATQRYIGLRDNGDLKPPVTYEEFEVLDKLGDTRVTLLDAAKATARLKDLALADALVKVAADEAEMPQNQEILAVARGEDLLSLAGRLKEIHDKRVTANHREIHLKQVQARLKKAEEERNAILEEMAEAEAGVAESPGPRVAEDTGQEGRTGGQDQPGEDEDQRILIRFTVVAECLRGDLAALQRGDLLLPDMIELHDGAGQPVSDLEAVKGTVFQAAE